jgi:5-formyltetrahydrofolate cyclo-ligase
VTERQGDVGAKRELRSRMRAVRAAIAGADRVLRSAAVCEAVIAEITARRGAPRPLHALLYEPLPGEPDLAPLADWCAVSEVETFLPEVHGEDLLVLPGPLDPILLDVVVVPGLAFTSRGDRLGQGGGHFDRFLTRVRPECLVIGVAFREQLVDELPIDEHDVAVDVVITD